jgi:hypothetical protein
VVRERPGRRISVPVALAAAVLGLLAGCSSGPPPSVTLDPVDISGYATAPCTLLTPDRAQRRHLQPPGTVVGGAEPGCRWNPTEQKYPSITADPDTSGGLAALHRGDYTYFVPSKIAGYPAVTTASGPGAPHTGHCSVRVGVSPHSRIDVTADYPAVTHDNLFSADPCADATTMATEIVDGLAAGSP